VLLDFWATWCGPCRAEAPVVDALSRRWHEKGVVVVGVNVDTRGEGNPRDFALSHGLTFPIVHDEDGVASHDFEVHSLPTLIVISPTGTVTAIRTGPTDEAELERLVRQALGGGAGRNATK
jgi:thiol-disulfide isomerase/thioredoxin